MAKVAMLLPYSDICGLAETMIQEIPHITPMTVEYIHTTQTVDRANELIKSGCELFIARGLQAKRIKQETDVPVVEIQVSSQDIGLYILELKKKIKSDSEGTVPKIGLIGFENMFHGIDHSDELYGVELRQYFADPENPFSGTMEQAVQEGCQALIGGYSVCAYARERNLPCCFLSVGAENIRVAIETASRICYAIDLEKQNSAEMKAMLDYTFTAIMQVNPAGIVQRVNCACQRMLHKKEGDVVGREIAKLLPKINHDYMSDVLIEGREIEAAVVNINQKATVMNIVPIRIDEEIRGATITFQEGEQITEMDACLRHELHRRGHTAHYKFSNMIAKSKPFKDQVAVAKRVAQYSAPILLTGEAGAGKGIFAQCIHNQSLRKDNAFISIDCSAWQPENLDNMLFGNYSTRKDAIPCIAEQAKNGTLYLGHVESLPIETQYKVFNLLKGRFLHNGPNRVEETDVRVIASTDVHLPTLVGKGRFRRDLYYAISVLQIEIPPLRERREDIRSLFDQYLSEWQEKYKRYIQPTQGAYKFIEEYDWPGNLEQLDGVCERIVLLPDRRSVDEILLRRQTENLEPHFIPGTEIVVQYKDPKAAEISELLKKHYGNRGKVAEELGVSKTTLWRWINKYGIDKDTCI